MPPAVVTGLERSHMRQGQIKSVAEVDEQATLTAPTRLRAIGVEEELAAEARISPYLRATIEEHKVSFRLLKSAFLAAISRMLKGNFATEMTASENDLVALLEVDNHGI